MHILQALQFILSLPLLPARLKIDPHCLAILVSLLATHILGSLMAVDVVIFLSLDLPLTIAEDSLPIMLVFTLIGLFHLRRVAYLFYNNKSTNRNNIDKLSQIRPTKMEGSHRKSHSFCF